jgi:transposase
MSLDNAMSIPFKSSPVEFHQHQLFPSNIFDLLPKDHECYLYADLFEQLDTTALESQYKVKGQNAYHPKSLVSILIYAYSRGVFSSRQIERRCNEDLSFMFIAQMNCPNFRVLSDFRKNQGEFFQDCFKQTVKLAMELKLASLGHISLDGSKFKANTSKHKAMSYGRLKEKEQALCAEIDELIEKAKRCDQEEDKAYQEKTGYEIPEDLKFKEARLAKIKAAKQALEQREESINPGKAIDDKKQISFADTEARIMGKNGSFDYAYNAQISVDADLQIIVGQHISQNANDKQEVEPALQALKDTAGRLPDKASVDNGYWSGGNLQAFENNNVDAYIATDKGEKTHKIDLENSERKVVKADFEYNEADNCFICPNGQSLPMISEAKDGSRVYQGRKEVCEACSLKSRCCQSEKGHARTISTDDNESLRQDMARKMETPSAQAIYKQRKVIVEPVFGQIKNTGFRGFSVRGKDKVAGEFSMVCAAHNFKKIAKAIFTGLIHPEFGNYAANNAI